GGEGEAPAAAIFVVLEIALIGAEHAEAAIAVAEGERDGPRHLAALGDVLIALPADIVRRVADAEHRIEQELDAAGARADDQVGARDRIGETRPRAGADLLHAEQERHADGDGD